MRFKSILLIPIIVFAKILTFILKLTGKGSGTALPGLIIEKYFPFVFSELLKQIPNIIVITGTNGKTTCQSILKSILDNANFKVMSNSAGSNMKRGILAELIKQSTIFGKIPFDNAIFEVEEATLPKIAELLNPTIIAVTNLYRDQLDAYGEIDITEKYIRQAIEKSPNAKVVLNADDPRTSMLTNGLQNETYYVNLPEEFRNQIAYENQENRQEINNKTNTASALNIKINNDLSTSFDVIGSFNNATSGNQWSLTDTKLNTPGFFHLYNVLIASSIAVILGFSTNQIHDGLLAFKPAFGRGELVEYEVGNTMHKIRILLIKNPAGFSLNLELLKNIKQLKLLIIINDKIADGKDVSWLWDSNVDILNNSDIAYLATSGTRAKDMLVRIKYAINKTQENRSFSISEVKANEDIESALKSSLQNVTGDETLFVLPTYTAMLELRKILGLRLE